VSVAYLPPVVVSITGNEDGLVAAVAKAKAALDSLKTSGGDVKLGVDVNTASIARAAIATDALAAATTTATNRGGRWTRWLATAHNVLTLFGANIVADTIGIVAFGVGAVAAFGPVVEAVGNLGATYGYLNPLQKNATVQITNFIHGFQAANNAGIFAVFTQLLNMAGQSVGKTGGIIGQATIAFENFAAMLRQAFSSAPWQQLLSRSSGIIEKDLNALFGLITALINVIPALFHNFNSLGLAFISGATAILHFIAVVGDANPNLLRFASMVFLVYRALGMLGAFNSGSAFRGLISGVISAGKYFSAFGLESLTLIPVVGALGAAGIAAGAGLLIGAAGGIALAIALGKGTDRTQQMIQGLTQMDHATGTNVTGYQELAIQLGAYNQRLTQNASHVGLVGQALGHYVQVQGEVSAAQQKAQQTANTLMGNLQFLEHTYNLTQQQAYQLAKATGVNLFQAFNKGGGAAQQTRLKIAAYEQTVKAAQNPTTTLGYDLGLAANKALALDDRVTALTNAFNALLTPFANVISDTVTWKDGNNQLEAAVDKAHGKVNDMGGSLQRLAASGLAQAINNTVKLSQDTLQQSGSMAKAIAPVENEIKILQALGSKSSIVAQAIANLQAYINNLHSKTITLRAIYQTVGSPLSANATLNPGYASGTGSASPGWHWVGERGPELAYMRGGEKVIPHQASMAIAGGYASGTGGGKAPVIENVIMLDGQVLYKSMKEIVAYKNFQNNVRTPHGSAQGRMGAR
jgi:hypothetical protein